MKTGLLLLLSLCLACHAEEKVIRLKGMDTEGEEFSEILRRVADARGIKLTSLRILQRAEGGTYLATKGGETIAVDLPSTLKPADGETFPLYLRSQLNHYEYVTVLGSKATVKHFTASFYPSDDLVPETLTATLKKGGEVRYVYGTTKGKCSACKGFGYTRSTERGAKPGKSEVDCPTCNDGLVPVPQKWVVKW